jgi:hypothetical protein
MTDFILPRHLSIEGYSIKVVEEEPDYQLLYNLRKTFYPNNDIRIFYHDPDITQYLILKEKNPVATTGFSYNVHMQQVYPQGKGLFGLLAGADPASGETAQLFILILALSVKLSQLHSFEHVFCSGIGKHVRLYQIFGGGSPILKWPNYLNTGLEYTLIQGNVHQMYLRYKTIVDAFVVEKQECI